jgi:hypothetical protein
MMRDNLRASARFAGGIALLLLGVCAARAQSDLATVTGVATDPAQAVVPGVTITIRHVETNIARTALTGDSGDFTVTNLHPGSYEISAELPGFRTYRRVGVVLEVGQVLRNDIQLEIGAPSDSVNVTAAVPAINTESGAIKGDVIVQEEIRQLPLDGRDFTDLAFLVPGVVPLAQGGQGSAMVINGARGDSTNFVVDGFNNRNPRGAAAQVRPNIGALQEFKVETSGYSSEYGRMAGGILNMVLRSGTNQLHGDFFEYVRNDVFDSRAFFDTRRLPLRRNQFGATVGGPVVIPKLYDGHSRTFFLLSWESFREVLWQSAIGHTPTAAERSGNFAGAKTYLGEPLYLRDPLVSGTCSETVRTACFPNNTIPASRFHPASVRLMEYYPLPNRPDLRNNYIATSRDQDFWDSFLIKLDHKFSANDSTSVRYQKRTARNSDPFDGSNLGIFGRKQRDDRSLFGLDHTHVFSPKLLIELRTGITRNATREREVWAGRNIAAELGIPGTTSDADLVGFPRFTVLDYFDLGAANNQPVQYYVTTIQGGAKFTWVRSKHLFKWGFDVDRVRFNQPYFNNSRGTFNFQDRWTNHPIGDFLLGMLNSATRTAITTLNYVRATSYGAFFNDDYKVTRDLTLNLGLRYELDLPPVDRYDRASNFVPELNKIVIASDANVPGLADRVASAGLSDRVALASAFALPRALVYADRNNFAPRVGFAWRPFGTKRTVLRAGWGIFYTGHLLNPIRTSLMTGFPFSNNETYNRLASNPNIVTLSDPFPVSRKTEGGVTNSNGYDVHAPTGDLLSYNLTVERDLGGGTAIEVGYVGSKGTHLGRRYDINQPIRTLALYQAGATFPRPYTGLNAINFYSFGSNSSFNSGQISLRKRGRGGLFYRVNYSFSKSIDDASQISDASDGGFGGAQNARDLKSERGRSDFDRSHTFTAAFSWQLPVGRRHRFLAGAGAPVQAVLGGWQMSGTVVLYSGQTFTVTSADFDAAVGESQRPNRLGSGAQADLAGQGRRGVDYPWFNITDFERVPRCLARDQCQPSPHGFSPFQFGNAGRNILEGPGTGYANLSLTKNFRLKERRNFQFRYEVFNITNHPNFRLPNRQFNTTTGGLISSVTERGRGGPRVMQLALKFEY